jgi:predicted ABC-type sugar transport system permease subunit
MNQVELADIRSIGLHLCNVIAATRQALSRFIDLDAIAAFVLGGSSMVDEKNSGLTQGSLDA